MSQTLFKEVSYSLSNLIDAIEMGDIGLPEIQRPFVWKNSKVRDLFDSMFCGYPVGYLLLWENQLSEGVKQIGTNHHQKVSSLLIVDGQQRMTSLFAVLKGIPVVRENYEEEKIEIAFCPYDGSFEVADAAIRRDPEYLPNISELFAKDASQYSIIGGFIERVKEQMTGEYAYSEEDIKKCEQNLQRLFNVLSFPFTALQLSSSIDEEQVADVFVRINSKGKSLNQSDFILTLMSVFWEEGRRELEDFCRKSRKPSKAGASPYNQFLEPDPDQLLRVAVGYGFKRARLKYAYSILRGKDLETGEFSNERRDEQFEVLKDAQSKILNLAHWHDFLAILKQSGVVGANMINSQTTVYYVYVAYLIARIDLKLKADELSRTIGRWYAFVSMTSRYTGSSETAMDRDLGLLDGVSSATEFVDWVEKTIQSELTEDYWTVTLPSRLETSSAISPLLFAYYASLNLMNAKALFSKKLVRDVLDPSIRSTKSLVEKHHLFPKRFLSSLGLSKTRETNQIANYALIEWKDNISIAGAPPAEYLPEYWGRLSAAEREQHAYWHALPSGWESMDYPQFLDARRKLIALVIRDGFDRLAKGETVEESEEVSLELLISRGEGPHAEFKSTLRKNLHTNENDAKMEHAVLKTIAAFLNSKGGTLFVGVNDDGDAIGLDSDGFPNEDKMALHLDNLIKKSFGLGVHALLDIQFSDFQESRILTVRCEPSDSPVFLKSGQTEEFFVRAVASSPSLPGSQMHDYIKKRFS